MTRIVMAALFICNCLFFNLQANSFSKKSLAGFTSTTGRTDSFEVVKYHINLDVRNLAAKTIQGYTDVLIKSKVNGLAVVKLDLLKLTVNDVTLNNTPLTYMYDDTALFIVLDVPRNTNDSFTIRVAYQGTPQTDKKWGGFYFQGAYAYNMGVGFDANPHNYGRVWFPCVDDFKSRSLYSFSFTVDSINRTMCNGTLTNVVFNLDGSNTMEWELHSPIPTYLASVAIAPYRLVNDSYNAINGPLPIMLAAHPNDTAKMRASFAHLKDAIAGYESWYGPHRFERVGFNAVPFSGGAMEHATNIAYPIFAIDGTTNSETLMAHEFAHHWWGDNTTCRTPEDMWLNEGWASYSEKLFLEFVYGKKRYNEAIMANHYEVVRWAHLTDGKPWPVSGITHNYTYGDHVYKKGADVVHTLRTYMGDAAFKAGIKDFQEKKKYSDVSTDDLKNTLQPHTTANLDAYFKNWIYTAGFPAFSAYITKIDFVQAKYNCTVTINQQLRFTNDTYTDVPLELSFIGADGGTETRSFLVSKRDTQVVVTLPINPIAVVADRDNKLSDAVTENEVWIKNSTPYTFNYGMMTVTTAANAVTDSSLLRVEQHWTAPVDGPIPYPNLHASGSRYWRVLGNWKDSLLNATATIIYDGTTPGGYTSGWLDNDLIKITEDSLVLLYRPDPRSDWEIYPYYTKATGNKADKRGNITLNGIKKGEYVFAMYDKSLGNSNSPTDKGQGKLEIYPNPTDGQVKIEFDDIYKTGHLQITDNAGRSIESITLYSGQNSIELDTANWKPGIYYVSLGSQLGKKLVVK